MTDALPLFLRDIAVSLALWVCVCAVVLVVWSIVTAVVYGITMISGTGGRRLLAPFLNLLLLGRNPFERERRVLPFADQLQLCVLSLYGFLTFFLILDSCHHGGASALMAFSIGIYFVAQALIQHDLLGELFRDVFPKGADLVAKTVFIIILAFGLVGSSDYFGRDRYVAARARGNRELKTRQELHSVLSCVSAREQGGVRVAPVELPKLVEWLGPEAGLDDDHIIDFENRTIRDAWGRDVIVIQRDGWFAGLGSAGDDGRWEGGKGDDIVYTYNDAYFYCEQTYPPTE